MDRPALKREVERFDPTLPLSHARTPPATWYTDPAFLRLEQHAIFRRQWLAVGALERVAQPGDYLAGRVLDTPYIVVRGEDHVLRAFFNVCRHHAAGLLSGCGRTELITCPYHGWAYGLDGSLQRAPGLSGIRDFKRSEMGLRPLSVEVWGPLVFIHLDLEPEPLAQRLAPLKAMLDETGWMDLSWTSREHHAVASDWKVYVDNYLDGGYHVPVLHPGLSDNLDLETYKTEVFDRFSVQYVHSNANDTRIGPAALYAWIYPNVMLNRYGSVLDVNIVNPRGPAQTEVIFDYWFADVGNEAVQRVNDQSRAASAQVQDEDAAICASVQRGLASGGYEVGRYAPRYEASAFQFHQLLRGDFGRFLSI